MSIFLRVFALSLPLFATVLVGYAIARIPGWRTSWSRLCGKLVFGVALPALLFQTMSDRNLMTPRDHRLLYAFFGGCLLVFIVGRLIAYAAFRLDGTAQAVFALGGIFSNNVMLGVPLARIALGPEAVPACALVIVFNSLLLWSLVSISVEWSRHGAISLAGFGKTALSVLTNPIVAAILLGSLFGATGWTMPSVLAFGLNALARSASPAALLALGMSLIEYGLGRGWQRSLVICGLKLIVQPAVVWGLAHAIGLPALETRAVVLLASMSVGVNVYLMAVQFDTQRPEVAGSLVLSTALAAFTTPLWIALMA
jgi:malonate transporter